MAWDQKAYLKAYRKKNREQRRIALQEWRKKNPGKVKAQQQKTKAWQTAHPERNAQYLHRGRVRDPERFKAYARKDYKKHRVERIAETKAWAVGHPERTRQLKNRHTIRQYGITLVEYDAMHVSQFGLCAICHQPETAKNPRTGQPCRLAIDHDPDTGIVVALLCRRCNAAIGHLRHRVDYAENAVAYLQRRNVPWTRILSSAHEEAA